jgi:hypothetical protein
MLTSSRHMAFTVAGGDNVKRNARNHRLPDVTRLHSKHGSILIGGSIIDPVEFQDLKRLQQTAPGVE